MDLSLEQKDIVNAEGNICVDAVAGSGKTTVAVEYVKARPDKRFLYTCFNRSVRDYAEKKFPSNVEVKNTHSLAYHQTKAWQWEIAKSFDLFDVIDVLKIKKKRGEKNYDAKLAGHILRGLNAYFNSAEKDIKNFDYLDYAESGFAYDNEDKIEKGIKSLNAKMEKGDCEIVHNFYLKQFQISEPALNYDYIIGDEFQDCSPCVSDIFDIQTCNKLVLGDKYQGIYRWMLAEDALEKFKDQGYETLKLTQSFRFRQDVADLAKQIINLKKHIGIDPKFEIKGVGGSKTLDSHAYLARSNIKLIEKAADIVSMSDETIHFEGDLNKYMFADGVGIYDIFFLWRGDMSKVKNKFLRRFGSYKDYREFLSELGSPEQEIFCNLVEKYKGGIFQVMKEIKARNVAKDKADIILSTVHKAKGIQYSTVELAQDFIRESQIVKAKQEDYDQISEEINILYVAATRVVNKIDFPNVLNHINNLKESKL